MLDIETLKLRSATLLKIRTFLCAHGYIELDTPAMSPIPPETDCELFTTMYDDPWTGAQKPVYLLPSHDFFLKKAVTTLKVPVFQLSKSYRNGEVADSRTSPEFSLLEAYTPDSSPNEAAELITSLLADLVQSEDGLSVPKDNACPVLLPPYQNRTLENVFKEYAGFTPSRHMSTRKLAEKARELGLPESASNSFSDWSEEELFELILTQKVVPLLPKDKAVFITNWPAFTGYQSALYAAGTQLAVVRSEKKDGGFPKSSVIELYTDRLVMLLAGKNSIENVIPFPFRLKKGYY